MDLITGNHLLEQFCERVSRSDFITVDTEFIREKTYWPELCLIQLGAPKETAIIDPLAKNLDLSPFFALMENSNLLKVFHAARQDLEIFFHLMGNLPSPIFDTQIFAMVCGFSDSVGYETLTNKLAQKSIDKTMQFSDWKKRPLSEKQLSYALADVTHLRVIYANLIKALKKNGRTNWVKEEMDTLNSIELYKPDPRSVWKRLKIRNPNPRFLAILREVAAWREKEAQRKNKPRNWILKDMAITEIALQKPTNIEDLHGLRGVNSNQIIGIAGKEILEAVEKGIYTPDEKCPVVKKPSNKKPKIGAISDLLKVLLKLKSETHGVAQKLIASTEEINEIAINDEAEVSAVRGWRRQVFGADAIALKRGQVALTTKGRSIKILKL